MAAPALQALLAAAAFVGIEPAPPPAAIGVDLAAGRRPTAPGSEVPKEILRLGLDEISRDQARAWTRAEVGSAAVDFSIGFDPEASLWGKFRASRAAAFPLDALTGGIEEDLGFGPLRLLFENGNFRVHPVGPPQSPQGIVSVPSLVRSLYDLAVRVSFPWVEYSVLYEDGSLAPASICLLREARDGTLWVTHRSLEEMKTLQWIVSINGVRYAMRLEDRDLVFYAKPAPA